MGKHRFVYFGEINNHKVYLVKCQKTGGEFSTELWNNGKAIKSKCVCCGEEVR